MILEQATQQLVSGEDIAAPVMNQVMEEIMTGQASTPLIVAFLIALEKQGETVEEVVAAVQVMRAHAHIISTYGKAALDTCGTGGDEKNTFNISTAVAIIAAGSGVLVAKHGNRAVSSKSGSADCLEKLGVHISMQPREIERCLDEVGIAFLFAPQMHPAMKHAMPARSQIKRRTVFNVLGPLCNPTGARHQLVGVYDRRWTKVLAEVLINLGTVHALVVHGQDGLDEITTGGRTFVAEARNKVVTTYEIAPEDFGIPRARIEDIAGGTPAENAAIIMDILKGTAGPLRDIVVLNAGAALYAADKVPSIQDGIRMAVETIDSKMALEKLMQLQAFSDKIRAGHL
ncbi:MAG TPA: anthranilate phosphoribosyltransferase [Candidatus Omnitrophota bacterium]|nr:anthranilate phosphoribosyltransferase [Candidatus Omnitrophota bacterium]HPT06735.1 anthranilate phosphoribosyltransferase [Candidatus Omnitrophota bacterium]